MPVARGGHIIRVLPVEARFLLDGPFVVLPPARLDLQARRLGDDAGPNCLEAFHEGEKPPLPCGGG